MVKVRATPGPIAIVRPTNNEIDQRGTGAQLNEANGVVTTFDRATEQFVERHCAIEALHIQRDMVDVEHLHLLAPRIANRIWVGYLDVKITGFISMSRQKNSAEFGVDHVGRRRQQWAKELPDLDTSPMAILGRARWIAHAARPAIEAVFSGHDLDTGEFDVLSTLLRAGSPHRLRPTELFKSLMISSSGLTDRLNRLERAGLIERPASEGDGRSLPVQLTHLGRARTEATMREDMDVELGLLSGLSPSERDQLARLLEKLAAHLAASIGKL